MFHRSLKPVGQQVQQVTSDVLVDNYGIAGKARRWLTQLVLVLVVVSSVYRFTNLDGRFYWHDEAMTSLRTAGHNPELIRRQIDRQLMEFQELQQFQRRAPNSRMGDMVNFLAVQDAKHPPLYFMLVWAWRQIFGDSITAIRAFSALTSLLIFPALYWLGWELFSNTTISAMLVGITAFSPIHLLFAQEARSYSLWTVLIIASSAALLRALKQSNRWNWLSYLALSSIGLYTQTLFVLVLLGHGLYVGGLSWQRGEKNRFAIGNQLFTYLGIIGLIGAMFAPWLSQIVKTLNVLKSNTAWVLEVGSKGFLIKKWLIMFGATIVDWDGGILSKPNSIVSYLPKTFVVVLVGAALYFLWRNTSKRIWLLPIAIMTPFFGCLMLPDLILGGQRSIASRYFLGVFIALQIAVAFLFSVKIFAKTARHSNLWKSGLMLLLVLQIISCTTIVHSQVWWTKFYNLVAAANVINQGSNTLVISDLSLGANFGSLLALSHQIKPGVKLQLVNLHSLPALPPNFDRVLLFSTADPNQLLLGNQNKYQSSAVPQSEGLIWQFRR